MSQDTFTLEISDDLIGLGNSSLILGYNNGMDFSTPDQDNDARSDGNCAALRFGGWWYNSCSYSNLNSLNLNRADIPTKWVGITLHPWRDGFHSLKSVRMSIKAN